MEYRSGFIAIVGRPNAGKSTLLNAILKEKIAIMSDKPNTTRNNISGILTKEEAQYILWIHQEFINHSSSWEGS